MISCFLGFVSSKRSALSILALAIMLGAASSSVNAQVVFDDANGVFASSDGSAPTLLDFNTGSNVVNGVVSAGVLGNTRNFYTFTIDTGQELSAINLDSLSVVDEFGLPSTDPGFFALVSGTTAVDPSAGFNNLGGELFDGSLVGANLLDGISNGGISGGTGFTVLGAGDYTFVIQQTGLEVSTFSLDFQVSSVAVAVPEPTSAIVLIGLGVAGLARRRR